MADSEHIQWIEEGRDAWNKRRESNHFVPDFSDLRGEASSFTNKNLAGFNLSGADFSGSPLLGTNFSDANLAGANFSQCILAGSNFSRADLSDADFSGTYLEGRYPYITHRVLDRMLPVRFMDATITDADFSDAHLAGVDFGGTDPSSAILFSKVEVPKQQFVHETEIRSINDLLGVTRHLRELTMPNSPI